MNEHLYTLSLYKSREKLLIKSAGDIKLGDIINVRIQNQESKRSWKVRRVEINEEKCEDLHLKLKKILVEIVIACKFHNCANKGIRHPRKLSQFLAAL